jgi:hypothetical protein
MAKDIVIRYVPKDTTREELKRMRAEFSEPNTTLIIMVSGKEKLMDNLQNLINVD